MSDYLNTYAFCLLGNHFHLLVKLNDVETIFETARKNKELVGFPEFPSLQDIESVKQAGLIVSNQFRKFFMFYSIRKALQ